MPWRYDYTHAKHATDPANAPATKLTDRGTHLTRLGTKRNATLAEVSLLLAAFFHGVWLQTDYSGARAAYQGHYAEVDEWEPIDEVRRTREALRAAGCEETFYTYPGVGHWFFEENRIGHYDAHAARLAWQRTVEFLRARLGPN